MTVGPQVAVIAAGLGLPFMPWQAALADLAGELDDDGSLFYREIDVTVPRQSGKTAWELAWSAHRLTKMVAELGPQRAMYMAQRRLDGRKKLEMDFAPKLRASRAFRETAHRQSRPTRRNEWRLSLNNGMEHIQFGPSSYLQIDAPSPTGGHGDTLDLAMIDEAFAHQSDEAEGAVRPAQATRRSAQLVVVSTAGNDKSFYLWRKVLAGRAACESGTHGRVAYTEYSAADDEPYDDPRTWQSCSPALGHTIDIGFLESEWSRLSRQGPDGINTFRRAYLNQWPVIPKLPEDGAAEISPGAWEACADHTSVPQDPVVFGVDVSPERGGSIVVAAASSAGGVHVEMVEQRPGTEWIVSRARELQGKWAGSRVGIVAGSPAWSLEPDLLAAGVQLVSMSTAELAQACGSLADGVRDRSVKHRGDAGFVAALRGAKSRPSGDAWLWSRKSSSVDISPIVAATVARWVHLAGVHKPVFVY